MGQQLHNRLIRLILEEKSMGQDSNTAILNSICYTKLCLSQRADYLGTI
jgi:hypothetical protein